MKTAPSASADQSNYSAFYGDYTPVEARAAAPAAVPNGAAPADSNATPPQTTAAPVECAPLRLCVACQLMSRMGQDGFGKIYWAGAKCGINSHPTEAAVLSISIPVLRLYQWHSSIVISAHIYYYMFSETNL